MRPRRAVPVEFNPTNQMFIATIDLTGVTAAITDLGGSVVGASALVITAALGVGAIFYGGRALWRFFKGLAK